MRHGPDRISLVNPRRLLSQPLLTMATVLLLVSGFGGVVQAGQLSDDPVVLETNFDPESPSADGNLTIHTLITIDPSGAPDNESVTWSVTFDEIGGLEVSAVACGTTSNTSCVATWESGDSVVVFSGVVQDATADITTADVTIAGTIADEAEQVAAETCATASLVPTGATPESTPTAATPCSGEANSIEVPVAPPVVPTEEPTEVPTEEPTEVPTEEPTEVPTEIPTEEPTATPEPTATATTEPTATTTSEPTATATSEPTVTATLQSTATATPESTATATVQPTATSTSEPTATMQATQTPVVEPTPTEDDSSGGGDVGLWIGVGALVVLAGAAGVVWNQRRNTP